MYIFVNIPRIWANAVILSISPLMGLIMGLPEIFIFICFSHFYVLPLSNSQRFPSGILTAATNFITVCGPFRKIGHINLFSNILLMIKIIVIYPIVNYQLLLIDICDKPDIFRCWNSSQVLNISCSLSNIENVNLTIPTFMSGNINLSQRPFCNPNETPNELLFQTILPFTLIILAGVSIPIGYLIPIILSRDKLTAVGQFLTKLGKMITGFLSRTCNVLKSIICCCSNSPANDTKKLETQTKKEKQTRRVEDEQARTNDTDGCCDANLLLSFFDNIRTIFGSGQVTDEVNCKYSSILSFIF